MQPDWSFVHRPFWLFSHVFVGSAVVAFLIFASWQWDRHQWRQDQNAELVERSTVAPLDVAELLGDGGATSISPSDETLSAIEFTPVIMTGRFVDDDLVDVANRSQAGVAGSWRVGVFQPDNLDSVVLVNRGFVPQNDSVTVEPAPTGTVTVHGWLRLTQERGTFGPVDSGQGAVAPRFDVEAIGARVAVPVAPVWFQLAPDQSTNLRPIPDPVALPEPEPGPHLGYVGQWIIFTVLTIAFYVAVLHRRAKTVRPPEEPEEPEEPGTQPARETAG